jgi:uncharacterized membrane protein YdbT with pleckstrin-like domain
MDLAPSEHVIFEGHPSWRAILGFYLIGVVVAAGAGLIGYLAASTAVGILVFVVAFAVVVLVGLIRRISTVYLITNRRLHIRRGIVARKTQEASLQRVQNVNTSQGAFERLMQIGKVDFDTAAGDDYNFIFDGVAQPEKVVRAVDRAQHEFQQQLAERARAGEGL